MHVDSPTNRLGQDPDEYARFHQFGHRHGGAVDVLTSRTSKIIGPTTSKEFPKDHPITKQIKNGTWKGY